MYFEIDCVNICCLIIAQIFTSLTEASLCFYHYMDISMQAQR